MIGRNAQQKYTEKEVDEAINALISVDNSLKEYYLTQFNEWYSLGGERLYYIDIAHVSHYVVDSIKSHRTNFLDQLFDNIETILTNCDSYIETLMVVGLFEGIQNSCGTEIDYHLEFNKWLRPVSKVKWDDLIDGWEGTDWRNRTQD